MAEQNKQDGAGKLAVVTGASSGIGFELARQLAKNGFDLIIIADEIEIHEKAEELKSLNVSVEAHRANLAKKDSVVKLNEFLQQNGRPVDVLVLNAGVGVSGKFVGEIPLEEDLNLIALNIASIVHLAKLVLPQMVSRHSGKVLITSSIAALMPGPYYATYAASKSFLLSFSEALFNELKDTGVTVTALMPGATDTNFFARAGMQDTKVGQAEKDDPAVVAKQGYQAMMKGEDHVIAGSITNKIEGFLSHFMSEKMKASIQRGSTQPKNGSKTASKH